jgi:glycosyltransferase involved in cell wall biosynthesis
MGMEDKRVSVTPNGVDSREFKEVSRKPSKIFKVLVHGAADERKNITNVLKAARLLADEGRNFQMNIIGMDEAELKCTRYPQEAAEMGLGRYVEWRGKVPDEKMRQTYTEADLLLYPSRWEGFGLPVLEAFACGVPVVTSNTTSLPEVAGNAALLVDPENPRAIAKAVRQLMERPTLRKLLVQRGMKRVKLFTWEKTARLTLKVYERMKGE